MAITTKAQRIQSGNSWNFSLLENKLRKLVRAEITKKLNEDSRWAIELFHDISAALEELNECGRTLNESGQSAKKLGIQLQKQVVEISRIAEQVRELR